MKFALRILLAVFWIVAGIGYAKDVTLEWDYSSGSEALWIIMRLLDKSQRALYCGCAS